MMIHDSDGDELADIVLSAKQQAVLETGEEIVVIYNTPQTLRHLLGSASGSFTLRKTGDRIAVSDAKVLRRYAEMQRAIKAHRPARKVPDASE